MRHNYHRLSVIFFSALLSLSACSTAPKKSIDQIVADATSQTNGNISNELNGTSAESYIRAALASESTAASQYLIKAAELLYASGGFTSYTDPKIPAGSTQAQINRNNQIRLLAAKLAIVTKLPQQALELLPQRERLTALALFESNTIRAQALLMTGRFLDAIRVQIETEQMTEAEDEKEAINQSIWRILSSLPTVTIENIENPDDILKGWLDLALVMRNAQSGIALLQEDILNWGTKYPLHPVSNTFIAQLLNEYVLNYSQFENIAIFLPGDGKYKLAADVISNGFLSAYYDSGKDANKPVIRFYDTSRENVSFDLLYEQAIKDGADVIVGPLEKEIINQLVTKDALSIPILTLNYAEDSTKTANNVYQFGLLPEDEASQVAEFSIQQNKRNAAILVPDSEWGTRLATAFQTQFEFLGGEVLSQQRYTEVTDDYSKPIRALLNLDDSDARYNRLKQLLNTKLEFTPRRRQDIDMIFIAATNRSARGIVPALKFHHAADIQMYATSHVYTGHIDKAADRDLNGLKFCDIPWTITSKNKLKNTFMVNWSNQGDYTRLYALGVDAYALMRNLNYLKKHRGAYFTGETGNIIIDDNNRLHRKLIWSQFIYGKPVHIDPAVEVIEEQTENDNS